MCICVCFVHEDVPIFGMYISAFLFWHEEMPNVGIYKRRVFAEALIITTVQELHRRSHHKGPTACEPQVGFELATNCIIAN